MFCTIVFDGGLGNQLFQYAFYLRLKKRHPLSLFAFDIEKAASCHAGYQLDQLFNINTHWQAKTYRRIARHLPVVLKRSRKIVQSNSLKFEEEYLKHNGLFTIYQGFWQSEKYFIDIANTVREVFTFKKIALNEKTKELIQRFQNNEETFVSVHIRRGDYLLEQEQRGLCDVDYYKESVDWIKTNVSNPTFVFFSDDIEWVRENIHTEKSLYVDWNHDADSWQDMYLMSLCSHNIIANSSFSWWGAWLNANKEKTVIAPKHWFLNRENYDILPDRWIKL